MPEHYLKAFTIAGHPRRIWVYRKGRPIYAPGHTRRLNPTNTSIEKASTRYCFYSCTNPDGTVDIDRYEKLLRDTETVHAPILAAVRQGHALTWNEQQEFARYILLLYKRSPGHQEETHAMWQQLLNKDNLPGKLRAELMEDLKARLGDRFTVERVEKVNSQFDKIVREFEAGMPDQVRLDSMLDDMPDCLNALLQSRWTFLLAPPGKFFVASDSPVFLKHGFKNPTAEVYFPITSNLLLVSSHPHDQTVVIGRATNDQVDRVNFIMCRNCHEEVYASVSDPIIVRYISL